MPVQTLVSHPNLFENRGRLAVMRGPLLYCLEQAGNDGLDPRNARLAKSPAFTVEHVDGLLGGVTVLRTEVAVDEPAAEWGKALYLSTSDAPGPGRGRCSLRRADPVLRLGEPRGRSHGGMASYRVSQPLLLCSRRESWAVWTSRPPTSARLAQSGGGGDMKYGQISSVEKPVARIVQGTTVLDPADPVASFAFLDAVFEQGGTTFDAAQSYLQGDAERMLGRWMAERGNHDQVLVITKGCHHTVDRQRVTPYDLTADLHDSLARLGVERIDLYLLHRDNPDVPVEELVGALNAHIDAGKIGAIGASNWTIERIQAANLYAREHGMEPFVASSPNYSLADQIESPWANTVSISGPENTAARAWYRTTRMPIFAWSSLAHGFLSGHFCSDAPW